MLQHASRSMNSTVSFNCELPSLTFNNTPGEASLCYPPGAYFGEDWAVQLEERDGNVGTATPFASSDRTSAALRLVIDSPDQEGRMSRSADSPGRPASVGRIDGPWSIINGGSGIETLRISACVTNPTATVFSVKMNSSWAGLEPDLSWDHKLEVPGYDTTASRRQLGASMSPEPFEDRGVLDFTYNLLETLSVPTLREINPNFPYSNRELIFPTLSTLGESIPDRTHTDLFHDILRDTGSPALVLQGLLTRVTQMIYYNALVEANATEEAVTAFSSIALMPVQWTGFAIGVCLIATHLVILMIITALFLCFTRSSVLGGYWQAVSQVASEDTLQS
ncbi:hypothetical protein BDW74DRAFT_179432 [Aspergillus multicolor]|uniref:uncharacterized protein n=1 Tax=Aspergillus multicolor TaxID=41759 RepID=UPI003CCD2E34